jgi:hypothetical protein
LERLIKAGKAKMQAMAACMRKQVLLCYGVLKNRAPFDPDWASKKPLDNTLSGSACHYSPSDYSTPSVTSTASPHPSDSTMRASKARPAR